MKKIAALTFTLLMLQSTIAQNYQVIRSDRTVFYRAEQASSSDFYDIDCIRIDSLKVVEQDSVFYPFSTIYQISEDCYGAFDPSLFGKQVISFLTHLIAKISIVFIQLNLFIINQTN